MKPGSRKILIVCSDRAFSACVGELLLPLGCQAVRALSLPAVTKNLLGEPFDLFLLCLVPSDDQTKILADLSSSVSLRKVPLLFVIAPEMVFYAHELEKFLAVKSPITSFERFTKEVSRFLDEPRTDAHHAMSAVKLEKYAA